MFKHISAGREFRYVYISCCFPTAKKKKDQGEFCQQEISSSHLLNPKGHHMEIPGHITFTPPSRVTWRSLENPPFENGGTSIDSFMVGFSSDRHVSYWVGWLPLGKVDGATPMYCLIMSPHLKLPPFFGSLARPNLLSQQCSDPKDHQNVQDRSKEHEHIMFFFSAG